MRRSAVVWFAATLALIPAVAAAHPPGAPVVRYHDRDGNGGDGNGDGFHIDRIGPVYICTAPNSCPQPQNPPPQKAGLACLIPVPYHCDPHPDTKG